MLKTLTSKGFALAAALTFMGGAAHADNHIVEIADGAYLPIITYAGPGDNIIFYNESDSTHTINGPDDSWTSGAIAPGQRFVLNITHNLPKTFSGDDIDGLVMNGEFTFDPAPLDEGS